jgi:N-methylhydantoinase A
MQAMKANALGSLKRQGFAKGQTDVRCAASLRYKGQSFELTIPLPNGRITKSTFGQLEDAFGAEHERNYGHRAGPDEPVEIVTLQVIGRGIPNKPRVPERIRIARPNVPRTPTRRAYFGPANGWCEVPVFARGDLMTKRKGPCIIEEYDATCIVPINGIARLDRFGNILMALK